MEGDLDHQCQRRQVRIALIRTGITQFGLFDTSLGRSGPELDPSSPHKAADRAAALRWRPGVRCDTAVLAIQDISELAAIREAELAECLRILGVDEHRWPGYPDGGCAKVNR